MINLYFSLKEHSEEDALSFECF